MYTNRSTRRNAVLTLLILPFLGFLTGCFMDRGGEEQPVQISETDISIGMSLADFKRLFPDAPVSSGSQWRREADFYGLAGEWVYTFGDGRLAWYVFNAYESEVTRDNFDRYLAATRQAIEAYSSRFGEPVEQQEGIEQFQDPSKTDHRGYRVLEARWNRQHGQLKIAFTFMGENLPYRFFMTIEART